MVRKTPRPPEEARKIARALRERFISPEMEAKALETLKRLNIDPASLLHRPDPIPPASIEESPKAGLFWGRSEKETILSNLREREGIVLPESDKPFTEEEKRKAKAILALFKKRYGTPGKLN